MLTVKVSMYKPNSTQKAQVQTLDQLECLHLRLQDLRGCDLRLANLAGDHCRYLPSPTKLRQTCCRTGHRYLNPTLHLICLHLLHHWRGVQTFCRRPVQIQSHLHLDLQSSKLASSNCDQHRIFAHNHPLHNLPDRQRFQCRRLSLAPVEAH
jgi:hypothetical protein